MRRQKQLLFSALLIIGAMNARAQGTMNIHRGTMQLVDLDALDSVGYQTTPPPELMVLYHAGGQPEFIPVPVIDSITYSPGGPAGSPQIATWPPTFPSPYGVTMRGWVGNEGESEVVAYGICYGTSPLPDLSGQSISVAEETAGLIQFLVDGLQPATLYYARAFATNDHGTAYGNQVSFITDSILDPALNYGTVSDPDGNAYATIAIGSQVWMAENLRTTSYANGDPIPHVPDTVGWAGLTSGAWAHVLNGPGMLYAFGRLYNHFAVTDPRNVCPTGWHVPSDAEWQTLESTLGMPAVQLGQTGYRGTAQNVGGQLRTQGQWHATAGANNASGFSGLPAGLRNFTGTFSGEFFHSYHWTTTTNGPELVWVRMMSYNNMGVNRELGLNRDGMSVRCVMD